jgi:hypothetical protein
LQTSGRLSQKKENSILRYAKCLKRKSLIDFQAKAEREGGKSKIFRFY